MAFLSSLFGSANERYIKSLEPTINLINELEKEYEKLSSEELKNKTLEFKDRLSPPAGGGEALDDILAEAFAAVREASKRTLGQRHYDVQLMGGIVLHQGKIAEMKTGEGKTLVATLSVYLNALEGKGAHVVTVNDYLARRDVAWMGQIYHALGLSTGCINHETSYIYDPSHVSKEEEKKEDIEGAFRVIHELLRPVSRREAYQADITYGTNNEYGFDYLRDNMAYTPEQMVQRDHHFAIVDEVDSILIDEARTPLIISAPDTDSTKLYETFSKIVPRLAENEDYNVDEKLKAVSITDNGIEKVEQILGMKNIYDDGGIRYVHHLEQALKAHALFKRDRDYVVNPSADGGEVIIVDEFTGRLMPGRRWSEGLHQAVEAKEGVQVQKESRTMATITFQNYFRLYKKLAGMTGTAQTSAEEFHKVYKLDVVTAPTNKPLIREDHSDRIYKTEQGKFRAIAREVKDRNQKGQPVLIGTVSIEKNELLSKMLDVEGVPHTVLNAKNHEKDAEIVAQAGVPGVVTLATNIAGRGVDIILGGNPPDFELQQKARELGGLHVIGTERHEARRIDDQLRGRAGRQGDPGSSQFFVSAEDELVRIFGGDRLKSIMDRLGVGEEDAIENRFVSNAIQQAQSRVEGHNFDIRKYVLEYDDVMNKHRGAIYGLRREALFSDSIKERIEGYLKGQIDRLVQFHMAVSSEASGEEGNVKEIEESFRAMTGIGGDTLARLRDFEKGDDVEGLTDYLLDLINQLYDQKEKEIGEENMRRLEKIVMLRVIDELWVDHIEAMEYLRDSVRLRAYGQRDPLAEYKIEAQKMFQNLILSVSTQVADLIFKVSFINEPRPMRIEEGRANITLSESPMESEMRTQSQQNQLAEEKPKIGRNDPCPCGSGRKWKRCGLLNTEEHQRLINEKV